MHPSSSRLRSLPGSVTADTKKVLTRAATGASMARSNSSIIICVLFSLQRRRFGVSDKAPSTCRIVYRTTQPALLSAALCVRQGKQLLHAMHVCVCVIYPSTCQASSR
jgi:hypothetical protein